MGIDWGQAGHFLQHNPITETVDKLNFFNPYRGNGAPTAYKSIADTIAPGTSANHKEGDWEFISGNFQNPNGTWRNAKTGQELNDADYRKLPQQAAMNEMKSGMQNVNDLYSKISAWENPYDASSNAYQQAMALKQNQVRQQSGAAENQIRQQLAQRGMGGGAVQMSALAQLGGDTSRALSQTGAEQANAFLDKSTAFEQQRNTQLADLGKYQGEMNFYIRAYQDALARQDAAAAQAAQNAFMKLLFTAGGAGAGFMVGGLPGALVGAQVGSGSLPSEGSVKWLDEFLKNQSIPSSAPAPATVNIPNLGLS